MPIPYRDNGSGESALEFGAHAAQATSAILPLCSEFITNQRVYRSQLPVRSILSKLAGVARAFEIRAIVQGSRFPWFRGRRPRAAPRAYLAIIRPVRPPPGQLNLARLVFDRSSTPRYELKQMLARRCNSCFRFGGGLAIASLAVSRRIWLYLITESTAFAHSVAHLARTFALAAPASFASPRWRGEARRLVPP